MSEFTILDDVFVGRQRHSRKLSVREVLGDSSKSQKGHQRFYSNEFIPFVSERNIKNQLIKEYPQDLANKKQNNLWKLSLEIVHENIQDSAKSNMRNTLIDARFKLHEVSHFRDVQTKSHLQKLLEFKKELKSLQNRDYERKNKNVKAEENFWLTHFHKAIQSDRVETKNEDEIKDKKKHRKSIHDFKRSQSQDKLGLRYLKRQTSLKQNQRNSNSYKSLLQAKSHRNPELQEIQRQVKVHFNHPELDRLKQSRKLTFKFLQNLQKGDKKFKSKVQEFRTIKDRIKKEMTKF